VLCGVSFVAHNSVSRQPCLPVGPRTPSIAHNAAMASIIDFDDLSPSEHSHEFVGAEHDDVPFSVILVHSKPGVGPRLHRHPYPEVFVVESGQATFRIGDEEHVVEAGHVVVSPPGEAHGFTNTGTGELRLTAIHGAGQFDTEWLAGADPVWASRRTPGSDR
jgi:mannose-6-phosphate isomerase-like protein (cupin superfamily)